MHVRRISIECEVSMALFEKFGDSLTDGQFDNEEMSPSPTS
jgi:hypothetical protein